MDQGRREDMESGHIDNKKLSQVVNNATVLDQAEVVHLSRCEECLEMIRILVRRNIARGAESS